MSAPASTPPATGTWPADVLAFAAKEKIDQYLEPLRRELEQLFSTALEIKPEFQIDPELAGVACIAFAVTVPHADVPDYVSAYDRWYEAKRRVSPATVSHLFVMSLRPV
jgi:hypothetical protein